MLVLFETPAGYALFKLKDESKLATPDALQKCFEDPESAAKVIKLQAFGKFADTVEVTETILDFLQPSHLSSPSGLFF
jgi:nucleolar protein 58